MKPLVALIVGIISFQGTLIAVSPNPGPIEYKISSKNGKFYSIYRPGIGFKGFEQSSGNALWSAPNIWYSVALLSDDGRTLIGLHQDGKVLDDLGKINEYVPISIFTNGKLLKSFKVTDFYPDQKSLQLIENRGAYYNWCDRIEIAENGILTVNLPGKEVVMIALSSAKILETVSSKTKETK